MASMSARDYGHSTSSLPRSSSLSASMSLTSTALRPRVAPIDRAEALTALTATPPTITSPLASRTVAKGPGARLHGHQSYFGNHRAVKAPAKSVRRTPRVEAEPAVASPVESEYIQLLQQQIFFLELKLNLLKKNDPFSGVPLEGPLEEVVSALRAKYATMEAAFKKELEELKKRNDELEIANVRQSRQIDHGSKAYAEQTQKMLAMEEAAAAAAAEYLEAKLLAESEKARLIQRLEHRDKEADDMQKAFTNIRADLNFRLEKMRADGEEKEKARRLAERKLEEAERRVKELESMNLELREDTKRERDREADAAIVAQIAALKSDKIRLEEATRRAQMATEQAEAGVRRSNELRDKLLADNTQLRLELSAAESKADAATRRNATEARSSSHWSTQIVDLRKRVDDLNGRIVDHPREIAQRAAEIDALRQELARANSRIEELQARLDDDRVENRRLRDDEKKTEENNVILRKEATIRQKELDTQSAKVAQLQEEFDRTKEERDNLADSLRVLQGRFDILKALGNIHIEDFQGMASTNIKVASAIDALAGAIRTAPHPPGPPTTTTPSSSAAHTFAATTTGVLSDRERKS